ncbi:MAG: alpha-ketoglutarate-dependent dioxygenase AlkB [Crocinitomicaceae bacterium]|nr:MAG: alpha-ketoglutarate-dependent dioxygenase AlkB [Crocinitomicaceae bacterium]
MNLFDPDNHPNLLVGNSVVELHSDFFNRDESERYFKALLDQIPWEHDEVILFGKRIVTARKMAWYASDAIPYSYSNTTKDALPWNPILSEIKARIESLTNEQFNACLLNLYHDGTEGMGWHSDDEKSIVPRSTIVSVSFGATRKFVFKNKKDATQVALMVASGSVLLMKGDTQKEWNHALMKSTKVKSPRINLTFRQMIEK